MNGWETIVSCLGMAYVQVRTVSFRFAHLIRGDSHRLEIFPFLGNITNSQVKESPDDYL